MEPRCLLNNPRALAPPTAATTEHYGGMFRLLAVAAGVFAPCQEFDVFFCVFAALPLEHHSQAWHAHSSALGASRVHKDLSRSVFLLL